MTVESARSTRQRKPAHAAAWAITETVTGALFSTATFLVMTWWIPAPAFGLGLLALALGQIVASLVEIIFADYVIATPTIDRQKLAELNAANIVFGLIMAAVLALSAPMLERALDAPQLARAILMLTSIVVCSGFIAIPLACMKRDMAFDQLTKRTLVVRILACCLGLTMAWQGYGLYAVVGQQIALSVANAAILLILRRRSLARPGQSDVIVSAFRFAGGNLFPSFMSGNVNRLLVFVVGFIAGPAEVAFVSMATRIVDALTFPILGGLGQVTLPILSRAKSQGYVLADTYGKAASLTSVVAIPAFVGLAICSPLLTATILAPHWSAAAIFISLLAIERAARITVAVNGSLLTIMGHSTTNFRTSLIDIGFGLLLLILFGRYGIVAGMIGWSLKALITIPLSAIVTAKFSDISIRRQFAASSSALMAALVMVASCTLASFLVTRFVDTPPTKLLLAVEIMVGAVSYATALHFADRSLLRFLTAQFRQAPTYVPPLSVE